MTAVSDAREQLEAVVHAQLTRAWKYGLRAPSDPQRAGALTPAQAILAAVDALPQPPRWGALHAPWESCGATGKPEHAEDGYICTAQPGHAPPHLAHDADGAIVHAWQDAGATAERTGRSG